MKKKIKIGLGILSTLAFVIILSTHLAPISSDSGGCAGGYNRWVADKHSEDVVKTFLLREGYYDAEYEILSKPEEIASTVKWNGRYMYLDLEVEFEGVKHNLSATGKRYWVEKFNWEIKNN